jgi:hypothetical protein
MTTLRILYVSDIHLLSPTVSTSSLIANLDRYFNVQTLKGVDCLCFGGDITDRLATLPDPRVFEIQQWVYRLLSACAVNGTLVRVLAGTKSHDFNQGKIFEDINVLANIDCDVRYFNDISIEFNEKLGISILYVPDEIRGDTKQTENEVASLLRRYNLKQVDIALMHGYFSYQTPEALQSHDESFYCSIVKHFISIGHVHTYSEYDIIFGQGSFDRKAQGEEGDKGFVETIIDLADPRKNIKKFHKNEYANLFITINIVGLDTKDEVEERFFNVLKRRLDLFPDLHTRPDLYLRVIYSRDKDFKDLFIAWSANHKQSIKWEFQKEEIKVTKIVNQPVVKFIPTPINNDTISDIYTRALRGRDQPTETETLAVMEIVHNTKERIRNGKK